MALSSMHTRTALFALLASSLSAQFFSLPTVRTDGAVLIERGHKGWRYWDQGETPANAWTTEGFDDATWGTGAAPLGYGVDGVTTEIGFGADSDQKHAAAYFRTTFDVADPSAYPVWLGELRCDDGAAVYLNGREVYRYNMPEGDLTEARFSAGELSSIGNRETRYHAFYLAGQELKPGENVVAISVHQCDARSPDLIMDFALSGRAAGSDPEVKPLTSNGVLEADSEISKYIDQVGKHLLKQNAAPDPGRLIDGLGRLIDREVELVEPSKTPMTTEELYEKCSPGVLIISGISEDTGTGAGHASGFVISEDGLALTNYHVVNSMGRSDQVVATMLDGRVVRVKEVLAANEADDVALIQLDGEGFAPLPIAKSAPVGSDLVAISHPRNSFFMVTKGQVARHVTDNGRHRMMVTTDFAMGSSGAPIIDRFGAVAGMVTYTRSIAYNTQRVHEDGGVLKTGSGGGRFMMLSWNHQMTLHYTVPCQSMHALLQVQPLGEAQNVEAPRAGLDWQLYEGQWTSMPDFASLEVADQGSCDAPAVDVHGGLMDGYGLVFEGFIDLPRDGSWKFGVTSDDGSRLYIDGERVVDNDGLHAAVLRSGYRRLAAGLHSIRIEFFDNGGQEELKVHFSGPGQTWSEVPASAFRRQ